uniref:E3 ubiquitin-protein ligase HECTD3-like n=1 Tax=Gouania willdenowi TaxID=441366 RepID=A0A8C5HZZ3_GOUWI
MSLDDSPHLLLGRIRFLNRCIESFKKSKPLPESLCYVPKEVCYKISKDSSSTAAIAGESAGRSVFPVLESPYHSKNLYKFTIELKKGMFIRTTGEEYCNNRGKWIKLNKEQLDEQCPGQGLEEGWILAQKQSLGGNRLVPLESPVNVSRQQQLFGYDCIRCNTWEQVVDVENALHMRISCHPKIAECDKVAQQKLSNVPPTWTYDCDEDLAHYLYDHDQEENGCLEIDKDTLGYLANSVRRIEFSSMPYTDGPGVLADGDEDTLWESAGKEGEHWIRLRIKKCAIVKKVIIGLNSSDCNFIPTKVAVYGGEAKHLKSEQLSCDDNGAADVCVLENVTSHLPVIEIRIEKCREDGQDVRIRSLKIESDERHLGLNAEIFRSSNLVRYPSLQGIPPDVLYYRAFVIQRFIHLLNSLLPYVVPSWDYSLGTFKQIKSMKSFLLLAKCRSDLIAQCLKLSETDSPKSPLALIINRHKAATHKEDPSLDKSCKKAVCASSKWPKDYTQWWECKFHREGILDHGGGFRDSLADMSEELCPRSSDCPLPLPFFIRTSNQNSSDAKDYYIPNPSCREFHKYKWLGQLMGAAFRGKDFLALTLPSLVWKQLTGDAIKWSSDFRAVDSVLVNLLEAMENMDQETFEDRFGEELVYNTLLSDGQIVELIPGGSNVVVHYEDRSEFIRLVQKARLEENKQQIEAMLAGLLKVVPQAVLDLITWKELETKVCGDSEITLEALKQVVCFDCRDQSDVRLRYFWEAMANFTNEDRSRLLRFITGRTRLPAAFNIFFDDSCGGEKIDELPRSSTCSNILYLPRYTSASICEEKLRYAAYSCVAIDNDVDAWE